ncbi:MAG: DNA-protecting protein DprA [Actinomycetota bacterium]
MLHLKNIQEEKDFYLILSWIIDSCDLDISKNVSKFGIEETLFSIKNPKYLRRLKDIENINQLKDTLEENQISYISRTDSNWPEKLKDLKNIEPYGLFIKGNFDHIVNKSVGIVGTRKSTVEGNMISTEIAFDLAEKGFNIVSGGAIGIDFAAHHGALIANGTTIVIQAAGLNKLYPSKNIETFNKILKTGLLISEYPPNRNANKINFLHRNRLIAALSIGTLVIEAGQISGALSTARYATKLNRSVMAIPGSILSKTSIGTNELIRSREAELVVDAGQIVELISPVGVGL